MIINTPPPPPPPDRVARIDFETYSEAGYIFNPDRNRWESIAASPPHGIGAVGAAVYSEHESTEILSLAYELPDGRGSRFWAPGLPDPADLFEHIRAGGLVEAHNSAFEFYIWRNVAAARLGWPELPLRLLRCSMARARAFSVPGSLEGAGVALGADIKKSADGARLLRKFSIPRNPSKNDTRRRIRPEDDTADAARLYAYNLQDIAAEAEIRRRTPELSPVELSTWYLDQRINARGVCIDTSALDNCIEIVRQADYKYTRELMILTNGAVTSASEIAKLQNWLAGIDCPIYALDSDTVAYHLRRPDLDPRARRALEIREILSSASVKKTAAISRRLCRDGRLRDLFAFCGAERTGRWAGRGPQPQNLPRSGPNIGAEWNPAAVEAALDVIALRSLPTVELVYKNALEAVAGCLRGLFVAGPGKDLICSDYTAIEAVVLAELAGEAWRSEVFKTHGMIYETSASRITGIPFEHYIEHKKNTGEHHPTRNKIGKVAELASGYGGGVGAWKQFGADKHIGSDEDILKAVRAWRTASPAIVDFWYGVERAAIRAVEDPGQVYFYRSIQYQTRGGVLYCRLPSGREIAYHAPELVPDRTAGGKQVLGLTYLGNNSDNKSGARGWRRLRTYGGKLTENIVQATSRDILANAMLALDRAGYPIVLHVHDEIVAEVPEGFGSVAELEGIMSTLPAWAVGWPVRASGGWRGKRYKK